MSKLSTLNYLVNSFYTGKKEVEILQYKGYPSENFDLNPESDFFEPSQYCIDEILKFASQYEVLKSSGTGNIELNLN